HWRVVRVLGESNKLGRLRVRSLLLLRGCSSFVDQRLSRFSGEPLERHGRLYHAAPTMAGLAVPHIFFIVYGNTVPLLRAMDGVMSGLKSLWGGCERVAGLCEEAREELKRIHTRPPVLRSDTV